MKVAVFGATGFMGYDFMRHAMKATSGLAPTAYATSAGSLANLSRHAVDIRLIRYADLPVLELEQGTEFIVNFAHPFGTREGLSSKQQSRKLAQFLRRQLESNPDLRLIHISSMSVYEPFAANHEFDEGSDIKPPRGDAYATDKAAIDRQILGDGSASDRVLLLRPTVVYGPMGKPWTDNIFKQFLAGDALHFGLAGKIQPLWVSDASRFIMERLRHFVPGILNLAGPRALTWREFLACFEAIVAKGKLREISDARAREEKQQKSARDGARNLVRSLVLHPSFKEFVMPLWLRFPNSLRRSFSRAMKGPANAAPNPFCRAFFEEDRLVSREKFKREFGDFALTDIVETIPIMKAYFQFRFTDGPFW